MLLAVHYPVMEHLGSLESAQEAWSKKLLRFFRALQISRVLHNSIVHAKAQLRRQTFHEPNLVRIWATQIKQEDHRS